MPGIDELAVDGGLTPHRFEPGAIKEGRQQRMPIESLIQSGDGARRALKGTRERRIDTDPRTRWPRPFSDRTWSPPNRSAVSKAWLPRSPLISSIA